MLANMHKIAQLTDIYVNDREDMVKRVAYRVGGIPNAEDVVQETFENAVRYASSFEGDVNDMKSWLTTLMQNVTKDFMQTERNQGAVKESQEDRIIEDLELEVWKSQVVDEVAEHIENMNEPAREVIRLFVVLGYSVKEVARLTGLSWYAVRQIIHRFKTEMKEQYA